MSTAKVRGDIFEKSVVLVLHHLKSGAAGIVLNKDGRGGPVGLDQSFTIHTLEARIPQTKVMNDIRLGLARGKEAAERLRAQKPAPSWLLTAEGYAGWSGRQLDYEIRQGEWRIIPFDPDIARLEGKAMWEAADKKAALLPE